MGFNFFNFQEGIFNNTFFLLGLELNTNSLTCQNILRRVLRESSYQKFATADIHHIISCNSAVNYRVITGQSNAFLVESNHRKLNQ